MKLKVFTFNPFQENTYLLIDESKECIIVDPGNSNSEENRRLSDYIEKEHILPTAIYNTHCHLDHIYGVAYTMEKYKIPFYIPPEEVEMLQWAFESAMKFGLDSPNRIKTYNKIDTWSEMKLGSTTLEILKVPGHSPGHFTYYLKDEGILIAGDTLFKRSIGRTDLPGGNHDQLLKSIKEKLYTLPVETVVFPGHGDPTTIGEEMVKNPFVKM